MLLVTTTDHVENRPIERYLGPIAAHVVAGTGFFSDLLAGLSDIFGGKSESYERQLESLHRDVLAALQRRALDLGANAVVGLRLDFDEISGKNMQMFMVTATGTAVRLEVATSTAQPESAPVSVDGQDLEVAIFRAGVARGVEAGDYVPTLHHLAFATLYGVVELAAPVADRIAEFCNAKAGEPLTAKQEEFLAAAPRYFAAIPSDAAKVALYDLVSRGGKARDLALKLVGDLKLTDFARIRELLGNSDAKVRARSLELLKNHPSSYSRDDLVEMEAILATLVAGAFTPAERTSEKKAFRSEPATFWMCACGAKVHGRDAKCYVCQRDEFGFTSADLNPDRAITLVRRRVEVLREIFRGPDSSSAAP